MVRHHGTEDNTLGQTIVKPTALGPVANTDTKLLIYGLFQKGRVLAQDGVCIVASRNGYPAARSPKGMATAFSLSICQYSRALLVLLFPLPWPAEAGPPWVSRTAVSSIFWTGSSVSGCSDSDTKVSP